MVILNGGCDGLYRILDKAGAEEKDLIKETNPLEKSPAVEEIQALLDIYGYHPGKIDGAMGAKTREAIVKFQKENGLKQSRFVDKETWAKLSVFKENKLIVDQKLNIALIQSLLKESGFDPSSMDGKLGSKTKVAIRNFQKAHNLKADERVGYKTLTKFAQYLPALNK